ncbi:MAG: glycosyltransferase family 2 protein [Planctomycetes bacterium]|nr:glycosyltransferase family 2 protein [Planctomycetota bacterium]
MDNQQQGRVAVVIPCYKVTRHILDVVASMPASVHAIYVVDDCCPEGSGKLVEERCTDERVRTVFLEPNEGVGGAVMAGYRAAIADDVDVIVKVDGDGQMDPELIPAFVAPILAGEADYTKGNRFYDLERIRQMPAARLFGNAVLSFLTKLSSGYWDLFDPTNGFTAIHANVARHLPFSQISKRYFFETDLLFRLNTLRATVVDIPMDAQYGDEVSNLKIRRIVGEFLVKHVRNFAKRIFYNYYLRDLSLASVELPLGLLLLGFGVIFGAVNWAHYTGIDEAAPTGTVVLAALTSIIGMQFLLAFLAYDIANVPKAAIHGRFVAARKR